MTNNQRKDLLSAIPHTAYSGLKYDDGRVMGSIGIPDGGRWFIVDTITGEITSHGDDVTRQEIDLELIKCLDYVIEKLHRLKKELHHDQ